MTSDKIKEILTGLGYKLSDFGNHWRTNALYRGGKNPTAVQIYKDSGVWVDYVKGEQHMPFKSLLEATLGTNDQDKISKITGGYDFSLMPSGPQAKPKTEVEKVYPKEILEKLLPHYKFYNERGISTRQLTMLNGGYATEGAMYQRFVFPIYNSSGMIHGFSGRDMSKRSGDRPKWKHIGKKSGWIYPYYVPSEENENIVKRSISESNEVIFVESIGDMLNLFENGIFNVLVSFGTVLSNQLICFIASLGSPRIVLSLNNDYDKEVNRGRVGSFKSLLKILNFFDLDRIIIHPPLLKDFGDMSPPQFKTWNEELYNKDNNFGADLYQDEILGLIKRNLISQSTYKKKYFNG
tara:strand:- start:247 stop:1299 length:1053 start_codon:yes stop_codon:yes gene_type:complete